MSARRNVEARVFRTFADAEQAEHAYWRSLTPAERLGMMWQLALDAWAFSGDGGAQSRLPRHIVCVHRRPR